ncbi:hypothetical protein CLV84_1074 [Neolewinella xylanilytica]|uniref:DUF4296 domain-containing protein n=1 Tax=Neolewinella xylanilytica TaxID=1514080 RepID=A0A2S6I9D3_9BACT|nr:hypothetical protein [Neolewinella xylanilytica]PPK88110.1 hypothetical protein CLV84_1074 [Neolewinella xylanilytica]
MRLRTLLLPLVLTAGCANVIPGPPPVDVDRLAQTIAELQLAESLVTEVPVIIRDSMQTVYYESILADHGFTPEEFDSVMWIIRSEPIWIDSVYTKAGVIVSREMVE